MGRDKCDNLPMLVEKNAPLQQYNTFGIMARAMNLVRVQAPQDIRDFLAQPPLGASRQGVVLAPGTWHHALLAVEGGDFAVVERRAAQVDCDVCGVDPALTVALLQ